jgi:hypothetical protein
MTRTPSGRRNNAVKKSGLTLNTAVPLTRVLSLLEAISDAVISLSFAIDFNNGTKSAE